MNKRIAYLIVCLFCWCATVAAQTEEKSDLQQRAEIEVDKKHPGTGRYLYIQAFEDYARKGQMDQSLTCGIKATELYYKDNSWKEAFELLRNVDQTINNCNVSAAKKSALHYRVTKERMQMYMRLKKGESVREQLNVMESQANASGDEAVKNDLLYNKALYYFTFGQNEKGNAVFKEMASKLTAQKEYDKVDEVYQTLIANGRRTGNSNLVAQSYSSYIAWKDSVYALKKADEIGALKKQIADNEAEIADKASSLTTRWAIIIGLGILAAALAAALLVGGFILLRFIYLTRKQKNIINTINENNALKAKFISNISAQLDPTLDRLDGRLPEVKALKDFSAHIQTLSTLESSMGETVEMEDVQIAPLCEKLMDEIRDKVKSGVNLKINAPKMTATMNKAYVTHIISHLLNNAAQYTPEGGHIALEFKKRGAHSCQFLVSDSGEGIPEEKRENVFKPFLEIRDLTKGDGLGLPICKQMAMKMNGDLSIDPQFTKGIRFVLDLHA